MKKANLEALQSALKSAQQSSNGMIGSTVSQTRARLGARYYAEPYGDEVEGRSNYVATDVRDTIESIKPELMDIFWGGDEVVSFAPRNENDVDAAEQETGACNYVVQQMNDGFLVFLGWFHDALTFKNGYIKRYWEQTDQEEIEEYEDLTPDERVQVFMQALEEGEVTVLEDQPDEMGRWSVRLSVQKREPNVYRIVNVPPEEVVVSSEWNRLDFRGCPYVAHKRTMPKSDLIEMGFDRKQVEALPVHDRRLDNEEAQQRFETEQGLENDLADVASEAMVPVLVYENYIRFDMDDDGIAELLQVYTAGEQGEILKRDGKDAIEQVDAPPFNVLSAIPIPHKHYGLSISEMVDDIARVRTVLTRQMIDNAVGSNTPDTVVDEDRMSENTVADLSQTGLGRNIRVPGGLASIGYMQPPQLVQQSLAALEHMAAEREQRTGVTRFNQGLDADSLNKTFGGMKALMNAAQKKILLIARVFAETGVRQLFLDMHRDLRKGPLREIVMRLNEQFVPVSPRLWKHRSDMVVNVGLGTGDRDIQFERLGLILGQQKEGLAVGLVTPKNVHHTLTKMVRLSGFRDVSAFFPEPPDGPMPQGEAQPDPAAIMAQVETQKAQLKAQTDMQKAQSEAQLAAQRLQFEASEAEASRAVEITLKREEMALDAQLRREEIASRERIQLAQAETAVMVKNMDLSAKASAEATKAIERGLT
jgi:hypothetical protein